MKASAWLVIAMSFPVALGLHGVDVHRQESQGERVVRLPPAALDGQVSLESVLHRRRSERAFARAPLTLAEVGQLAWAAQGVTSDDGRRTAPSAGALYPLELYVVAGEVDGLEPGVYRYLPASHHLRPCRGGDLREQLGDAALGQEWIGEAPCLLVLSAVFERTTGKYGRRGERYVHMEAGLAAQNALLQAAALDLGGVLVGAFDDELVRTRLGMAPAEHPLALLPIGRRP